MRNLKRNRPTIGVLAGWQTYAGTIHSFLDYVYRGIQSAAGDLGCNLLIGCGVQRNEMPLIQASALPIVLPNSCFVPVGPWNTDGLIVIPPNSIPESLAYFTGLIDSGFPLVFAGDRNIGPAVAVDNEGGVRQAIDHLVGHGHQRIAFIAGYDNNMGDSKQRIQGYLTGLESQGIPFDPDLFSYGSHSISDGYTAMKDIINRGKPFTAVIGSNDDSTIGAIQALHDAGLVVPQDIAVIGFDDRLESRAQIPLLTTVHHPMFDLGYQSMELIYQIIDGTAAPDTFRRIPTHLVLRESCGCLPGAYDRSIRSSLNGLEIRPPQNQVEAIHGAVQSADFPGGNNGKSEHTGTQMIAEAMTEVVYQEMFRFSRHDIHYLCYRLVDAYKFSLKNAGAPTFQQTLQQILEHVANSGDDLYAWQAAISALKDWTPYLLERLLTPIPISQVENMLHRARMAISEVSRGQYSRLLVRQKIQEDLISQMTSRFFSVQDEQQLFAVLNEFLAGLEINHAAVALYESEKEDAYAWSVLKFSNPAAPSHQRFLTRQFPPMGLFPDEHPYHLAVLPLFRQDRMIGYVGFNTSNLEPLGSVVRQLEAALYSVNLLEEAIDARRMAEEARHIAEQANQLKSRFLSMVSHELRTPLNLIVGLSNMMLEQSQEIDPDTVQASRKDLERIFIGAQHLESLIRDVLDLARNEVGQLNLTCEPLELHQVLETVSEVGAQLAQNKGLEWKTDIPDHLPSVRGDRTRLRQVVLNLINNAVKFTNRGFVSLACYARPGEVTIAVKDTGLGIPQDEQNAIFDEFHQSRRTSARGYGGLGLGLAICQKLVQMHGGHIGVTSTGEEGAGSTFFFTLPVIDEHGPNSEHLVEALPAPVLLLVKEMNGSQDLASHLTQRGFRVDIRQVQSQDEDWITWIRPDVTEKIILDLGLTSERGWEILKTVKENPSTRDIPVLFYALNSDGDGGALLDLNLLSKPVSSTELADEFVLRGLFQENGGSQGNAHPILIVDDDPEILHLHVRVLESMNLKRSILTAQDGYEALQIIRQEHPSLVLLDLMMPRMDGFCVIEAMQAEEPLRQIPVIVLTSQVLGEEDMERLNCGAAAVLSKGMYTTQETLDNIAAVLSRKRRANSESQRMVLKAISYLNTHYKDPITRSDVADYVGVSERHLARCFQQAVGLSPITYLNRLRVKVAKTLLDQGKLSITDVAMEVGFSAGGYFTRVFRDEVGVSPREYVRRGSHG
jgi:signal transduction histidine kinase/DNA-binding LacI/PurR family transcriptional regulator/DNA-binding response OmpR family regulator